MIRFLRNRFRDIFLVSLALVILYDQVFIARAAQPLLIFLVIFLFASVPALQGDTTEGESLFQKFVLRAMGIEMDKLRDGMDSSPDTPTQSDSRSSSHRSPRSRKP
jgi:hypothetical protein